MADFDITAILNDPAVQRAIARAAQAAVNKPRKPCTAGKITPRNGRFHVVFPYREHTHDGSATFRHREWTLDTQEEAESYLAQARDAVTARDYTAIPAQIPNSVGGNHRRSAHRAGTAYRPRTKELLCLSDFAPEAREESPARRLADLLHRTPEDAQLIPALADALIAFAATDRRDPLDIAADLLESVAKRQRANRAEEAAELESRLGIIEPRFSKPEPAKDAPAPLARVPRREINAKRTAQRQDCATVAPSAHLPAIFAAQRRVINAHRGDDFSEFLDASAALAATMNA